MGLNNAKELPKLTERELDKLSKLSGYSASKIQLCYNSFISDCPNGILTKKEFKRIYKQFFPNGKPNKFSNRIFDIFDRNKDNKIDFTEFLCALNITVDGSIEEKLKCAFEMYDLDGNGKIDKLEMKIIVDSIFELVGEDKQIRNRKLSEKKVEAIFEELDLDRDGYLTLNEFMEACIKNDYLKEILDNTNMSSLTLSSASSTSSTSSGYLTCSNSMTNVSVFSDGASSCALSTTSNNLVVFNNTEDLDTLTNDEKLYAIYLPLENFEQRLI